MASRGRVRAAPTPQTPRHACQFRISSVCVDGKWLESHTADRTGPRMVAHYLRMHRTRVLHARGVDELSPIESQFLLFCGSE